MNSFCVSIRWLDNRYHGQNAIGEKEWPPSPLRVFQAVLAGIGSQVGEVEKMSAGLLWLENQTSFPTIIAPRVEEGRRFVRYVPTNDSNKKRTRNRQDRLTDKPVVPTIMLDHPVIYYLWPLESITDKDRRSLELLTQEVRHVSSLGWGVDMAVGNASVITAKQVKTLPGERWRPMPNTVTEGTADKGLRVPISGTLAALGSRYKEFLGRGEAEVDSPPFTVCEKVQYCRAIDPPNRHFAAFSLMVPGTTRERPFDMAKKALTVAGMLRHATTCAAERTGQDEEFINQFVRGHGESLDADKHISVGNSRFAYLPLPSIEFRGVGQALVVGSARRAMLAVLEGGCEYEVKWAERTLPGQALIPDEKRGTGDKCKTVALLSKVSESKIVHYIGASVTWATVTPVVLPGYDDPAHYRRRLKRGTNSEAQQRLLEHLHDRIDVLLRKAIVQAGFSRMLADNATIEWRKAGFWRGTEFADRYGVPDHLKRFSRYHVRITWRDEKQRPMELRGPICIGGGRFYGLGLFAAELR